jgi:hypothetical protein
VPQLSEAEARWLAALLPDIPRWVETRSMLLSGHCDLFGVEESGPCFVVRDAEEPLVSVVERPEIANIREAVSREWREEVAISAPEDAGHVSAALPEWRVGDATIHLLGNAPRLPPVSEGSVRLLSTGEQAYVEGLNDELRRELEVADRRFPIVVGLDGGCPVSFCYVAAQTESLWDISINTLEGFRRRGNAARCVAYMVGLMWERGKEPVWGAEDWNTPSLALAVRLGFIAVDKMAVFKKREDCRYRAWYSLSQ